MGLSGIKSKYRFSVFQEHLDDWRDVVVRLQETGFQPDGADAMIAG
jgi:hypothetical protein